MTTEYQRAKTIRPKSETNKNCFNPIHEGSGDVVAETVATREEIEENWGEVVRKIEELEARVAAQVEDKEQENQRTPRAIKAPVKPTQEQWEQHQVTHAPYAFWCPHCFAARNVTRNRPAKGRRGRVVPDIETG